MKSSTLLLALTLSLLTLSCNKRNDSEQASSQDPTTAASSEQTTEQTTELNTTSSPTPIAKASPEQLKSTDIEKRKMMHQMAMRDAAIASVDKGSEGEEAFNKVMLEWVNDPVLYGERRHVSADQINDEQITYHLPAKATKIQLLKEAAGHYALYKISERDFIDHMVMVWERYRDEYVQ